jgi:hypothetical protein
MAEQTVNGALSSYASTALKINTNTNNIINLNNISSLVSTTNVLNTVVSKMYGVVAKWFRSVPVDRAKSVIFQEYTLYNIEDCGFDINVLYNDTGYDEAALQFNTMGIQYAIPLTVDIAVDEWNRVTNGDGTLPQKKDIVYIPQSNKLYQVVSMNPIKTVASQITSYRCNLSIYKPERSRVLNDDLEETINEYTTSVEKMFGMDINDEINDIVADKQMSPSNSTYIDRHKKLINMECIKRNDIYAGGHLLFKSHYINNSEYEYLVRYKNSNDSFDKTSGSMLSVNFMFNNIENNEVKLNIDSENSKQTIYTIDKEFNNDSYIVCSKGGIIIPGRISNGKMIVDNKILSKYPKEWYKFNNINAASNVFNLITGYFNGDNIFAINIIGNLLMIQINNKTYYSKITEKFKANVWYNISINFGMENNFRLFELNNEIVELEYKDIDIDNFGDINIDEYNINGSDVNLTNIRLYNENISDIDKQLINIISKIAGNESNMIISDNADEILKYSYFGEQR